MIDRDDARWLGAALALAERGVGRTSPNPSVGCIIVADGRVVGRGWTQPGGRPHAEAMALAAAGDAARGATAYVTLEPCAHVSARGPACSDLLIAAGVSRVVASGIDPDPRTAGAGVARLRAARIVVDVAAPALAVAAERVNPGFFTRQRHGRAHVTLKLAVSLDGCIALPDGTSRWITGAAARRHAHLERARCDLIVVGGGTLVADDPALDVRLDGLEDRAPLRAVLSRSLEAIPAGARIGEALLLRDLADLGPDILTVLVEGGAGVATTLLAADCVDRLLIYRAPILIGGRHSIGDLGLIDLGSAHGRWRPAAALTLGPDRVEEYDRVR